MKTMGALLWEPGTNSGWSVEEIEIDPPQRGEVMVQLAASGLCHSGAATIVLRHDDGGPYKLGRTT